MLSLVSVKNFSLNDNYVKGHRNAVAGLDSIILT